MKKTIVGLSVMLLCNFSAFAAEEKVSKEDVQKLVDKAADFAQKNGKDKAILAFNDKSNAEFFTKGGALYIFAYKSDGTNLALPAKPALNGKNLMDLKDSDGVPFIKNLTDLAKNNGKGWTKWKFHNPKTNKVEQKVGYVVGMGDWWLGSGVYESDCPECMK